MSSPTATTKTFDQSDYIVSSFIAKSKYTIYKATSKSDGKSYALKVFPFQNNQINLDYLNEIQTSKFNHKNIVKVVAKQDQQLIVQSGKKSYASCLLLELAPYGDFIDLIENINIHEDEKLTRTYFHQLIEAVEHIHSKGFAHMDLKSENMVVGDDFQLKVIDFDFSISADSKTLMGHGTKNNRAPELKGDEVENARAADIYSAGIFLFTLVTGSFPYIEDCKIEGKDLFNLMTNAPEEFWNSHKKYHLSKRVHMTKAFRELYQGMTAVDPKKRMTIEEIKRSDWYNGNTYSPRELKALMKRCYE